MSTTLSAVIFTALRANRKPILKRGFRPTGARLILQPRGGPKGRAQVDSTADTYWISKALELASSAVDRDEVPIGAIVVRDGQQIGVGANEIERQEDPTAHAELLAIRSATKAIGSRRLLESTLYVTLEPCAMCAGAVVLARIPRLVFSAYDQKAGACGSLRNVVQDDRLNHRCEVLGGVLADDSAELLRGFFAGLRSGKRMPATQNGSDEA